MKINGRLRLKWKINGGDGQKRKINGVFHHNKAKLVVAALNKKQNGGDRQKSKINGGDSQK